MRLRAIAAALVVAAAWASAGETPAGVAERLSRVNVAALRLAIEDLTRTFGPRYPKGPQYLARLNELAADLPQLREALAKGDPAAVQPAEAMIALNREALLANPLLDSQRLLLIKRSAKSPRLGLPANWEGNCSLPGKGFDDEIAVLSPVGPEGKLTTLYKPPAGRFVGDVDLHFDADRLLFSMPDDRGRWQVFELRIDAATGLPAQGAARQVTPADQPDVDNYDACYLPDGRIIFGSTACMVGVPCVRGASHVANLCIMEPGAKTFRQLCFDQDHNWCPTVLPNGRVLYTRWEYGDIPHAFSRILFHMNPDGTGQMEYYGSNSYWPNSLFYARPIPGDSSKFVAIVSGHHGVARMGELVLFDQAGARHEADGAIQRIGQRGRKVQPVLLDQLVDNSWPKFLHPWPLSGPSTSLGAGRYFLAAAQETARSAWCLYLVDVFDNMLKLREEAGFALLEPVPLRARARPPVIGDRVDLSRKDALVYLVDVYRGDGLTGVPRGTIKRLRLFSYHFAYHGMGGQYDRVGLDGPWDVKRIIGTVPVEADGSACFRVPANTPIAVQPLDADGQAVQLMRSWFAAMPGEAVTCVGCHERQETAPPGGFQPAALGRAPSEIQPWYGPARGFGFRREVQPVLDRYCVGCHDGRTGADGQTLADLRVRPDVTFPYGLRMSPSYYEVRRFVRAPTIESDLHMLPPWEFHASTTKLVQMLRKGHPRGTSHGVRLDDEAWDRLITWIDLGTPMHGTWGQIVGPAGVAGRHERRMALRRLYAGMEDDPEAEPAGPPAAAEPIVPAAAPARVAARVSCPGWPFDAAEAQRRQQAAGPPRRSVDLGGGVKLDLVRIPAGEFVMGDPNGQADEQPPTRVAIDRAFWIGQVEVTNRQYARFDPAHDSRLEHGHFLQFSTRERGYPLNEPNQPVVRVSWRKAMAFARWLSERTGERFALPTEAQWEYACRAGTASPLSYGELTTDHGRLANLADACCKGIDKLGWGLPQGAVPPWHPTDGRFNDAARVSAAAGNYEPDPWGLRDMHGNVCEWTRSVYRAYPYRDDDGRNDEAAAGRRVVRGGSWYDRPARARSAFRLSYLPCQGVYDVGFRVVCEGPSPGVRANTLQLGKKRGRST